MWLLQEGELVYISGNRKVGTWALMLQSALAADQHLQSRRNLAHMCPGIGQQHCAVHLPFHTGCQDNGRTSGFFHAC